MQAKNMKSTINKSKSYMVRFELGKETAKETVGVHVIIDNIFMSFDIYVVIQMFLLLVLVTMLTILNCR